MQNRLLYLWFGIILLLIVAPGCKRLQIGGNNRPNSWKSILNQTEKEVVEFETLTASGKVSLNLPMANMENVKASYRINVENGKQMLIRVSYIIEVARVLITRDSIFVQDKINKNLYSCDFSMAESFTGLQADYDMLQDIILGNYNQIPDEVELQTESKNPLIFKGLAGGSQFTYSIDPEMHKVIKINASNSAKNQASDIVYSDFQPYGGTVMPLNLSVAVTAPDPMAFEMEHKKIQINPSRTSFKLSSSGNYDKKDCP